MPIYWLIIRMIRTVDNGLADFFILRKSEDDLSVYITDSCDKAFLKTLWKRYILIYV